MTTQVWLAMCLAVATLPLPAGAQSLGDAARRAEEERARAKQETGKVYTNKDVADAPPPPPRAESPTSGNPSATGANDKGAAVTRRDERPRDVADSAPVSASEGSILMRTVGSLRGNATETTLTLPILVGAQKIPCTMVLRAVHEDRLPLADTPIELDAKFLVDALFLGKVSFERPHVVIAAGDPPGQRVFAGSVDERQSLGIVSEVSITLDLNTLSRLEAASKVTGRLFGFDFAMSAGQTRLIADFARRARRNPGRGPAI